MKVLTFDVETSTHNKGNWNDTRNELVCISWAVDSKPVQYSRLALGTTSLCSEFIQAFNTASLLVGFNIKFDLHWVLKYGCTLASQRIHDVQLATFLLHGQVNTYPSLEDTATEYLGKHKQDKVKEFWQQGIQTRDIPPDILREYSILDVELTRDLYNKMVVPPELRRLFSLCNQDLVTLLRMEQVGLKYNRQRSLELAADLEAEIEQLKTKNVLAHGIPDFNWGSPKQLASLLFGGEIVSTVKVPIGTFKSGAKQGQVKYGNQEVTYKLPRLFNPVNKTESGLYSTDDDTLVKLGNNELIKDIQKMRKLSKEVNTYLRGLPAKQDDGFYAHNVIYTQFNQCVTDTGRLSSKAPNVQNLSDTALLCMESRYDPTEHLRQPTNASKIK